MQTGCKPPVNHFIMNIYLKWKKYSLLKCEKNISFGICILIIISHDHKMETNVKKCHQVTIMAYTYNYETGIIPFEPHTCTKKTVINNVNMYCLH